jgi:hypothetical protein
MAEANALAYYDTNNYGREKFYNTGPKGLIVDIIAW